MKIWRKLHLWLSVPFGLIIAAICFSGAMLVFEPEITRMMQKDVYYVASAEGEPLEMRELMETVKATLPDSVSIAGVTVLADRERTYQVNLTKPRRASVFIDQYSGRITGRSERPAFFSTMFRLHRWLLDGTNPKGEKLNVGKLLVGISTIMFVVALITGIVIWVPRARRNLRRSLSISVSKGLPFFWKTLHVGGGMWALLIVLAMALTGLTYSFNWYRTAFYAVCGVEHTPRGMEAPQAASGTEGANRGGRHEGRDGEARSEGRGGRHEGRDGEARGEARGEGRGGRHEGRDGEARGEGRGGRHESRDGEARGEGRGTHSEFGRWQQVYDQLRLRNPEAPQITVTPDKASVTLGSYGNPRAADVYEFDRRSGEVTLSRSYADSTEADRLRGWIYAIHTGSLGGIITRILWFLAALLGASLPLTGYYIWIKHLTGKGKKVS